MKMILILTSKDDVTVDFIIKELQARKIQYYRLNTEDIPNLINIDFDFNKNKFELIDKMKNNTIDLLKCSAIYYRRPCINDFDYIKEISIQEKKYLQSEVTFILEGIYKVLRNKYWLNNVYKIREAENKILQLQIASNIGFDIPKSLISNNFESIIIFYELCQNGCIIKPIKSGNMKDKEHPKTVFTPKLEKEQLNDMIRLEAFPIYIQENVRKDSDIRITVVDDKVFTTKIYSQVCKESEVDWRRGNQILYHSKHELPEKLEKMCILLTKQLGLQYSAIDMILDKQGNYKFLEINPNGQWAWIEKRLGYPISKKIVDTLIKGGDLCEH